MAREPALMPEEPVPVPEVLELFGEDASRWWEQTSAFGDLEVKVLAEAAR